MHTETPMYEGGMSSEIEFQEVVSNSATADEPLGTLAGRGINTSKKGGKLHIKVVDRKSTRLNSSHSAKSRMPSSA